VLLRLLRESPSTGVGSRRIANAGKESELRSIWDGGAV
jgi:hypothetical protein